jgi:LysM repeat protein
VLSREGETISDISKVYRLSPDKVAQYNDQNYTTIQKLKANTRIFIQSKKDKSAQVSEHTVKDKETMFDIAQLYGVKLDKILQRNRMTRSQNPAVGQRIYLNGNRPKGDEALLRDDAITGSAVSQPATPAANTANIEEDGMLEEISGGGQNQTKTQPAPTSTTPPPSSNPFAAPATTTPPTTPPAATPPSGTAPAPAVSGSQYPPADASGGGSQTTKPTPAPPASVPDGYHLVVKGDTLSSIARKYNTTNARIKQLNNMTDDSVKLGQTLKVK